MPSSSRRARISVVERLLTNPQDFAFQQALRVLERAAVLPSDTAASGGQATLPVARFSPPSREVARFKSTHSLRFPDSEISAIQVQKLDGGGHHWQVLLNFIGLTGAMGVLPLHYTALILQRLRLRDPSLAEFLDLFNHRTCSLFFQAASKYRLPIEYERSKLHQATKSKDCRHTQALLSILGLGTGHLRSRLQLRDESLIFYSGLLTQQVRTPSGLRQIIQHYFGVPATIEGFIGQWQELIDDVRTRLPWSANRRGQNARLGRSCMLGRHGWFAQGKSRIKIGPLDRQQFDKFAPGTGALKALNELTRTYLGMEQTCDFIITVRRDDIPAKVALRKRAPPTLSWNTWLAGRPSTNTEKDDLLEIVVSAKKLN